MSLYTSESTEESSPMESADNDMHLLGRYGKTQSAMALGDGAMAILR